MVPNHPRTAANTHAAMNKTTVRTTQSSEVFVGSLARQQIPDGSRSSHRKTFIGQTRPHFLRRREKLFSLLASLVSRLCGSRSRVYKKLPDRAEIVVS